ncbi:hypothetical protein LBW78_03090 [Rothia kristinae]|uniref:TlpA family protein disulfide reductase n=1 Tax=Rothia kristinae TaxID=37923 RepID=UPI001CD7802F|nr:MauE/DoxX family redox-associated membrane protein [Rothia kristinae]MCA1169387.1 hypothetical protein [Rothia kristinae]MED6046599.1 MauE/DoxX family redox-associated membrane protein [Rothia kristinae]
MITAALALPLILAVVLVLSGIAKLRAPQTVAAGFRDLRVPAALDRAWLRALLPWGELVLAAALLAAPGALAPVAAIAAALLFLAYWVLIRRALSFEEPVSCGCFGEASAEPVSGWTLARNTVLALVALGWVACSFVTSGPGLIAALRGADALWLLGGALGALTLWLSMPRGAAAPAAVDPAAGAPGEASADQEAEDYVRRPTPGMLLRDASGELISLRSLASQGARLLLLVSPGCGSCTITMADAVQWRGNLGPVTLHLMTQAPQESLEAQTDASLHEEALYDVGGFAYELLGMAGTPTAVLVGADGALAGGPVGGYEAIREFVAQIRDQLAEAEQLDPAQDDTGQADADQSGEARPAS